MSSEKHYIGLSPADVGLSREKHGANVLTPAKKDPLWKKFLEKFRDPLIIILLVAGLLSIAIACYEYWYLGESAGVFFEPVGIFSAVLLATGLSFWFEMNAEKEFEILNKVNDDEAVQVIRESNMHEVPRRDVVVGDIVVLHTGDEVPADGRLLEATTLSVDESTLTGEPLCHKSADPADADPEATFPTDMVLRGTKVMEGHAVMEVTAVGDATEAGKVFEAAQIDNSVKTPLNEQLERLGTLISRISYGIAALIVVGRVISFFVAYDFEWVHFVTYLLQTFMIAVALIVVSVPEGLPMAVTLSLAYSMRRMLKTNNLVRKMHACETMGATTVICTDKTGTLTENKMQLAHADFFGNPDPEVIADSIALNTTAELDRSGVTPKALGNPTEGALLLWLDKKGLDYSKVRESVEVEAELPFTTERKYMATVIRRPDGRRMLYVKGAPEIVWNLCCDYPAGLTKEELDATLLGYQDQAMRTLGFAYQELADGDLTFDDSRLTAGRLMFLGIVAISDPVRAEVPDAIREVIDAGVKIKIVTGDTPGTAREIGRQIGLWHDGEDGPANIITGPEFAALSDGEMLRRLPEIKIIARARPLDKKRLVEALQSLDEVVAVTGDGTNDAPALKSAQLGLSMGDGTSVAKEASDITIIDNSFASIGRALMWGRSLYRNIQRFVLFQLTVNVVACIIVLVGAFLGTESPLTVTQMLWVNLIMDTFAAMALASLPPMASVMKEKPRARSQFIITPPIWESIIGTGLLMTGFLFAFLYYLETHQVTSLTAMFASDAVTFHALSPYEGTLFFTTFVFLQFWNMFNARAFATGRSALHFKDCRGFVLIAALIVLGQILIVTFGGAFFSVQALSWQDWLMIVGGTSIVLWVGEIWRLIKK